MKTVLNSVLLLWMLMSVGVQFNDPDGWQWILIYGYALVLIGLAMAHRYKPRLLLAGIVAYALGGFLIMPDTFADMMDTNEVARECIGLFITAGCLEIVWLQKVLQKDQSLAVDEVVTPTEE